MEKEYNVTRVTYYRVTVDGKSEDYEQLMELGNGCVGLLKAGKWRILNPYGKFICVSSLVEIHEAKEGMARIFNGKRYGYLDVETFFYWPLVFEQAEDFENGIAKVIINGQERYVCKEGRFVDE